jgi:hypothetical protein
MADWRRCAAAYALLDAVVRLRIRFDRSLISVPNPTAPILL